MSYTAVHKIENDTVKSPGLDLMVTLAKTLNVSVMKLILAYQGIDPNEAEKRVGAEEMERLYELAVQIVETRKGSE